MSITMAPRRATAWAATLALAVGVAISAPSGADAAESAKNASVLQAWGKNDKGQLDLPSDLRSGRKMVTKVALGDTHGLAITSDKKLYAWGDNEHGEGRVPANLQGLAAADVATGVDFSVVVGDDGDVRLWGDLREGVQNIPKAVADANILQVAAGNSHVVAKSSAGKVYAWGNNAFGATEVPAAVNNTTIQSVAASVFYSMALSSSGKVYVWGANTWGVQDVPAYLADKKVVQISAGYRHALALTEDNEIVAWGSNTEGALNVPALGDGDRWTQIAAGNGYSVGVAKDSHTAGLWGAYAKDDYQPPWPPSTGSAPVMVAAGGTFIVQGFHRLGVVSTPTVTGTARAGSTLTGQHAVFGPTDQVTKTGSWIRTSSSGAVSTVGTGTTYTLKPEDIGSTIVFRTAATHATYGAGSSDSAPVEVKPTLFTSVTKPVITGDAYVGSTLKGSLTSVPAADSYRYDWYADGVYRRTSDAKGEYVVQEEDRGKKITLLGYADKAGYERINAGSSEPTATVLDPPQFQVSAPPMVTGTPRVGVLLGVTAAEVSPAPAQTMYQWFRDGQAISGATGTTYRALQGDAGRTLSVSATYSGPLRTDTTSASQAVKVAKVTPKVSWKSSQGKKSKSKRKVTITIAVSAPGVPPLGGKVQIRAGGKVVKTLTLKKGKASYVVKLKRGKRASVKVTYLGTTGVNAKAVSKKLKVKK